jgi:6-phosphofructokinase 1
MKRVAVLTSGGDAPGMNAAIRAVVRTGVLHGFDMLGVRHGYAGLLAGQFVALGPRQVGGIIQLAGTVLGTSRCPEFKMETGQRKAIENLRHRDVAALIVIGGNGSQTGAYHLASKGFPVIGIASTIDNDLVGTDVSIGTTTAIDTALEAIDRLRVTAASHRRAFLVEVMGRDSGYLATHAAIAGGAEAVLVPETETDPETLARQLRASHERGKSHAIVVVAEGAKYNAEAIFRYFEENGTRLGIELRVTRLGHIQRGGAPGGYDRVLASRFGAAAIDRLARGEDGVLIGLLNGEVTATPLTEVAARTKRLDARLVELANALAT